MGEITSQAAREEVPQEDVELEQDLALGDIQLQHCIGELDEPVPVLVGINEAGVYHLASDQGRRALQWQPLRVCGHLGAPVSLACHQRLSRVLGLVADAA